MQAEYRQSMVKVSRAGFGTDQYLEQREVIDEHMRGPSENNWHVAGYHVMYDNERNVEEHNFIWKREKTPVNFVGNGGEVMPGS